MVATAEAVVDLVVTRAVPVVETGECGYGRY
jgi:hypothetical protein